MNASSVVVLVSKTSAFLMSDCSEQGGDAGTRTGLVFERPLRVALAAAAEYSRPSKSSLFDSIDRVEEDTDAVRGGDTRPFESIGEAEPSFDERSSSSLRESLVFLRRGREWSTRPLGGGDLRRLDTSEDGATVFARGPVSDLRFFISFGVDRECDFSTTVGSEPVAGEGLGSNGRKAGRMGTNFAAGDMESEEASDDILDEAPLDTII